MTEPLVATLPVTEQVFVAFGQGSWHVEPRSNASADVCDTNGRTVVTCSWSTDAKTRADVVCALMNASQRYRPAVDVLREADDAKRRFSDVG